MNSGQPADPGIRVLCDHLDVVRLLGKRQDIAAILDDEFASN